MGQGGQVFLKRFFCFNPRGIFHMLFFFVLWSYRTVLNTVMFRENAPPPRLNPPPFLFYNYIDFTQLRDN